MIERQQNPQVQKIIEWRETLSGMENQQFFSLIHLYLGEVKTPYNKQNLIEQLSSFIRKEENQEDRGRACGEVRGAFKEGSRACRGK